MELYNLGKISKKRKKIVGRGYGSGKGGHTAGRGSKGQKSRAGSHIGPLFEGGQNPLRRRLPRLKGFKRHLKTEKEIIALESLNMFKDGDEVNAAELFKVGLIKGKGEPKILDTGEIKIKVNVVGINCSKSAKEKIEKQGGTVKWEL